MAGDGCERRALSVGLGGNQCQKMRMYFSGPLEGGGLNSVDNVLVCFERCKCLTNGLYLEMRQN